MTLRLVNRAAVLLVATAAFAGACSDDPEPLTLDQYFAEFAAIDTEVDSQFDALYADFPDDEDAFADEANLDRLKELVTGFPRITGEAIDRLKDLQAPSEVETAHDALIDAGESLIAAFEEGVDTIEPAQTIAELDASLTAIEPTVDGAQDVFDEACLAVVEVATNNGIHTDVTCLDE